MAGDREAARLRQRYTGEPRAAALDWYRRHGLHRGLVPDALESDQELLEGGILKALARPSLRPNVAVPAGTLFGVAAASPDASGMAIWCRSEDLSLVLARLLPSRLGERVSGVPWLRPWARPDEDLVLGLIGHRARITVRVQHTDGVGRTARSWVGKAGREDLDRAAAWAEEVGGAPLWHRSAPDPAEGALRELLAGGFAADEAVLWSRALRRAGLFLEDLPDWSMRPPTLGELAGPNPNRIRARAVGPARTTGGGVVAVTSASGRGGCGSTTTALVLAAALARAGNRVALHGGSDPNSAASFFGEQGIAEFAGRGCVDLTVLPEDRKAARDLIAQARRQYDVVVLDAGFQHRHLVGEADLTLAVMTERRRGGGSVWTETEVTDRRPEHVRMWQWLDDQLDQSPLPAPDPVERMQTFLDLMFVGYAEDRANDTDPAVYDAADPEDVEDWWDDWGSELSGITSDQRADDEDFDALEADGSVPSGHADEAGGGARRMGSPAEAEVLDSWRQDFITFVDREGAHRHPEVWPLASGNWAARNKQRHAAGLAPGEMSDAEWRQHLDAFLADVEPAALATWGMGLWEERRAQWATAFVRDEDLLAPFEDAIEYRDVTRSGADVAADLAREIQGLPPMPVLAVLARTHHDLDSRTFNETALRIKDHGPAALAALPDLQEWALLRDVPASLADAGPRAAAASLALARDVADRLAALRKGVEA
ncbi:hypothetical protein ACFVQ9_25860 [Streptomyces goshikiensis]|uniref:nucleotide-binding protein n=1 Tax=Streptomyces goshikiensis TaxID=1942 RepID=UPI00368DF78A